MVGVGGPGEGASLSHRKQLQLSSLSVPPLWPPAKGEREMIPPGPKQLLRVLTMRIRKELSLLGQKRKERRWAETPGALPESNQGWALIGSRRLFNHKVHTGRKTHPEQPPSPTRSTFHSPTPVGVCRHVLLLPINNS